ncbi:MAG TPA: DUF120 domain-containing protein [Thermodesulfobacteriota bacterium]|nr:DUF120 domain-containing protein [Thermodesulfobacteriota bacterium]
MASAELDGEVRSGVGEGAGFLRLDWVRRQIREVAGFDPFPGTLNLRLVTPEGLARWRAVRARPGRRLEPPPPGTCGGWLFPVLVAGTVRGAVVVPDVTRYGEDLLEVVAPVHLRSRLGLEDGDRVRLTLLDAAGGPWPAA